ncbi:MAG: NAD(P)-dependent oxidoreductase [Proteobacteria bacterium]|nr:NAD(P)-dependent oxidoreductase [Pseudomonadota bacterium]
METVLITGAAGGIGTRLRQLLKGVYPRLLLSDRERPADLAANEEFIPAELADMAQMENLLQGVDGVIHLGGRAMEDEWAVIHQANILGCHNLFEAARLNGTRRVVFASSNHAIGFYPRHRRITVDEKVRPDSRYGVSKAFGEALGAFYAEKFGLGVLAIRIGNVDDYPVDERRLSIWISPRDLVQLIRIGLEHPGLRHEIVWGASDNARGWWDNEPAYRLGYRPDDHAEEHAARALAAQAGRPGDPVGDHFQGGEFCSMEFSGPMPDGKA